MNVTKLVRQVYQDFMRNVYVKYVVKDAKQWNVILIKLIGINSISLI